MRARIADVQGAGGDSCRGRRAVVAEWPRRDVVVFDVRDVRCCVDVQHVIRVILLPALDPIPAGPKYLRGYLSMAGCDVVVIDLAERLGLNTRPPYDLHTPVMLCADGGQTIGVIVSSVLGTATAKKGASPPGEMTRPFLGRVATEHGPALLLDGAWLTAIDAVSAGCGPGDTSGGLGAEVAP